MIFQVAIMCEHYNSVSSSHGMTYHTGHVLPQFETSKRNKRVYTYKVVVSTCVSTSSSGSSSTRIGVNMTTTKNETTTYTYTYHQTTMAWLFFQPKWRVSVASPPKLVDVLHDHWDTRSLVSGTRFCSRVLKKNGTVANADVNDTTCVAASQALQDV